MLEGRTYWLDLYGCQMNAADAGTIRGILEASGCAPAGSPSGADFVILVTCAVREHAETRALGRAAQLAGLPRRPLVAVCGCVAQEHGEALRSRQSGVDLVVGPDCYRDLPALLAAGGGASTDSRAEHYEDAVPVRSSFPRALVTISRGCDNRCSYCIVPRVRGPERSRPSGAVLGEIRGLAESGWREITLLGQNVNSYRSADLSFAGLLDAAAREAAPAWLRFVTSHPRDLVPAVAEVMASHRNICRALHLPAQSGSDRILGLMGRGYGRRDYLERIRMLRDAMPDIVLSTDMIAGFPGETEEDFGESLSLLEEVGFDQAFLFRYSERPGTPAALLPGMPVGVRLDRLYRMQHVQEAITRGRSAALAGRTLPVLVTGPGRLAGQSSGRSAGNRVVVFQGGAAPGTFVDALIRSGDGWTHHADLVRESSGSPEATEQGI